MVSTPCTRATTVPVLEVAHRQREQVLEHAGAEHGVHPIAGMQHEILPHPAHRRAERHDRGEGNADDDERVGRLVDDDLVDHHLGEERDGEGQHLDREGRGEDVAPDAPVLHELRHEPAEAEGLGTLCSRVVIRHRLRLGRELQRETRESSLERFEPEDVRIGIPRSDVVDLVAAGADH
jgi:hypothetical protein